jgi:hypothetical protein
MKVITLRNLPPELASAVRERAKREGISLTKTAVRLMEEGAGLRKGRSKRVLHHDLDSLAGSWTRKQADEFDRALAQQRAIDPELWK